jgi:hypothetical protein
MDRQAARAHAAAQQAKIHDTAAVPISCFQRDDAQTNQSGPSCTVSDTLMRA